MVGSKIWSNKTAEPLWVETLSLIFSTLKCATRKRGPRASSGAVASTGARAMSAIANAGAICAALGFLVGFNVRQCHMRVYRGDQRWRAFKIPVEHRIPTAMVTPYHVHKTELSDNTGHNGV
jgi:hypothetical protein